VARRLVLFTLAALLAACAPTTQQTATPAALPRLAVTPALAPWLNARLTTYAEEQGLPGFEVDILPPAAALESAQRGEVAAVIGALHPPSSWFAASLGREGVVVIVNPRNPVRALSEEQLAGLFSGRSARWEQAGFALAVQCIIPLAGDETRVLFETQVLPQLRMTSTALLAPSPAAAVSLVAEERGAVGFIPFSEGLQGVVAVSIEGVTADAESITQGRYPLTMQVLALAPREPSGVVRQWLAWLQGQLGP
jgi:hypothetical protein